MDLTALLYLFVLPLMLLPLAGLIAALPSSARFKGWRGEYRVRRLIRRHLDATRYHDFHNIILTLPDGTTQIDHVLISPFGVFVIETKHFAGRISGRERQRWWTQNFHRHNVRFQNPLRQNYRHLKAVEAVLEIPARHLHSVVVFTGPGRFDTPLPDRVVTADQFIDYIGRFKTRVLKAAEIRKLVKRLENTRLQPTLITRYRHIRQLQRRHRTGAVCSCPGCGSAMVLRTARRGSQAGQRFWGCSTYPKCRTVRKITA